MVMHPLQVLIHTDVLHSPNHNPMPKFWGVLDCTIQIMVQVQVLDILGIHTVMVTTGISRGMVNNTLDLMKDIISGIFPLYTHPLHH